MHIHSIMTNAVSGSVHNLQRIVLPLRKSCVHEIHVRFAERFMKNGSLDGYQDERLKRMDDGSQVQ
jgi:hypothetical protein